VLTVSCGELRPPGAIEEADPSYTYGWQGRRKIGPVEAEHLGLHLLDKCRHPMGDLPWAPAET